MICHVVRRKPRGIKEDLYTFYYRIHIHHITEYFVSLSKDRPLYFEN